MSWWRRGGGSDGLMYSTFIAIKNELISMKVIEDICNFLNCQPGDIMEMEKEVDKTTLLYNSNHTEGSKLTEDQTRYIYETSTIGLEKEPVNIDDIYRNSKSFSVLGLYFHQILKSNTSDSRLEWIHVGDYKQRSNMAGDSKTTPPSRVEKEMQRLLFEYQQKETVTFEDIVEFHYHFESFGEWAIRVSALFGGIFYI